MAELPERSDDLILELLDHWEPVTPCQLATHVDGLFGCRPGYDAQYALRCLHGAKGQHEPLVIFVCVWHVIWIRANARAPVHCVVCHANGDIDSFYEVLSPISHK